MQYKIRPCSTEIGKKNGRGVGIYVHEPQVVNFERLLDIPITISKTAANPSRLVSCWNKFGLGFPETLPHWTDPAARKLLAAQAIHETYEQGRRATE